MSSVLLLMCLLPLVGSALNGLFLRPTKARRAGVIATLFAGGSFLCALALWFHLVSSGSTTLVSFEWFRIAATDVRWGFQFDKLTSVMALIVTGIGTTIHAYSIGYMSEERTPYRYFAYLNLFLFAMLVLIASDNLIGMFVGWEGVGLCSYLLIGYWYQDLDKAKAGMKAFLVNRIGDAGFLIGIFLCFQLFGSVNFDIIAAVLGKNQELPLEVLNWCAFFLFVGAMGKSAQIPLYVWLPDAMAGPTPVSALIHAATMVTSGIYLVARMNGLYAVAHDASFFVACIGSATALLAALIATSQNDIKKVLAYSTVSQLGLMFVALGVGAYVAAIFHVLTHAFFKALMFLGSGSVIHALEGEQDIQKMGGLKKYLPITYWTFLIGTLAISGIPPLSGFFSKDLILFSAAGAHSHGMLFWALGSFTSLLTAFYMTRLFALTFLGDYRGHAHPHESPPIMTVPLILLAVGSVATGLLELPHLFHVMPQVLSHYLQQVIPIAAEPHGFLSELGAMVVATIGAVVAIGLALSIYTNPARTQAFGRAMAPLRYVCSNKFWVDEIYNVLFVRPFEFTSAVLARFVDPKIVDAGVMFPAKIARAGGTFLSFLQVGSAQFYLLVMLLGALAVIWVSLKGMVVFG